MGKLVSLDTMPTIINNPQGSGPEDRGDSSVGIFLGILIIILIVLFFIFGYPRIRTGNIDTGGNPPPTQNEGGKINVQTPGSIDVNVNKGQ